MNVEKIKIDRATAREHYRRYKEHVHWSAPMDDEIRRTYQLIAQGRVVIRAIESIKAAGLGDDTFPRLAIVRADAAHCFLDIKEDGAAIFSMSNSWRTQHHKRRRIVMPSGTFPAMERGWRRTAAKAIVPLIPLNLRPKRGLANYHILWEADWKAIPRDPMLLRRIGKGDLWLVVAAWDLTEVERAVLASRVSG